MKTKASDNPVHRKTDRKRRLLLTLLLTIGTLLIAGFLLVWNPSKTVMILFVISAAAAWVVHWFTVLHSPETTRIPVLMYHSVSPSFSLIPNRGLSVSPALFESHLNYLKKKGYRIVSLEEVVDHMEGRKLSPGKKVSITFDDGYQDNYSFAFPLLKRFGFQATVFMSTDFIRPESPPQEILAGQKHPTGPDAYLSWAEIREMEATGLIHVESHGQSHGYRFTGDAPVGFFNPIDAKYYWYTWKIHPDHKPYWHLMPREKGKGHPIFPEAPALEGKAFLPNQDLVTFLENAAKDLDPSEIVFDRTLKTAFGEYKQRNPALGRFETSDEYKNRVIVELRESRLILERGLDREIRFFAWPNDAAPSEGSVYAIENSGYAATTAGSHYNRPGEFDGRISRIYTGERLSGIKNRHIDTMIFGWQLKLFEGYYYWYFPLILTNLIQKLIPKR